jgi:hypothetical protein
LRDASRSSFLLRARLSEQQQAELLAGLSVAGVDRRLRLIASRDVDSADHLQLAFDTSDLAADLALAYFESGVSATLKADGTPVTEADRAVERLLRETSSSAT